MTTETKHMPSEREIAPVFKFLLGEGSLEGKWFGDLMQKENGRAIPYWWRVYLREALNAASQSRATVNCKTCGGGGADHNSLNDPGPCTSCGGTGIEPEPDQSERIRELEAELALAYDATAQTVVRAAEEITALKSALAEARKVIEALIGTCGAPQVAFAARDWLTRNPESSNGK